MTRTRFSLSGDKRALLAAEFARTGRSMWSLIGEAIRRTFGAARSTADDLEAMRSAFGSWGPRGEDSTAFVDRLRSRSRLQD